MELHRCVSHSQQFSSIPLCFALKLATHNGIFGSTNYINKKQTTQYHNANYIIDTGDTFQTSLRTWPLLQLGLLSLIQRVCDWRMLNRINPVLAAKTFPTEIIQAKCHKRNEIVPLHKWICCYGNSLAVLNKQCNYANEPSVEVEQYYMTFSA